jgi:hypothetical protein
MRRLSIFFVIAIVFALIALPPVSAGKPDCDMEPDHASCKDDTTPTTTQPPQLEACETNMTITGNGGTSFACLWTPVQVGDVGDRVATVTVSGITERIKGLPVVSVRDDAPGDYCLLEQEWENQSGPEYVAEFALIYDNEDGFPPDYEGFPSDYVDGWFGNSYWNHEYESVYVPPPAVVGAYWCGPQDPVLETIRFDTNGKPLHFEVYFNARGGGQVEIDLFPGQE